MGDAVSPIETNVVQLLRNKIAEKTGATVTVVSEAGFSIDDAPFDSVILPGTSSGNALLASEMTDNSFGFPAAAEAYTILTAPHGAKQVILIAGADTAGVLYGVGKFLRRADYSASDSMSLASPLNIVRAPLDDSRGPYFAIHCANWYESVSDTDKLEDLVKEQALWGANTIYVWFDMSMYRKGPFASASDSAVKWNRIKTIAAAAQRIGVKLGLVEILNGGYLDQTEGSPLRAVNGEPPEGLFCPNAQSQAARPIMEQNYRELYGDLASSGIDLAAVVQGLYDRGGCQCSLCSPWVQTAVGSLVPWHDGIVRGYFPDVQDYLCDWHFSDTEVGWVKNYLATNQPAWITGVFRDDRHVWSRWSGIPAQYRVMAFLDITMIGGWSGYGANPFPGRLDQEFAGMRANGIRGGMAYSEGLFDDLNKAVYLQKHWGTSSSADLIREYSKWYFNADDARQDAITIVAGNMEREWGNILASWSGQNLTLNVTNDISGQLDAIEAALPAAATNSWRWKLIRARACLSRECADISALSGSGYAGFCDQMDALLTAGNYTLAATALVTQKAWLAQRQADYAADLTTLSASVYEGTKSGMYDQSGPNPPRWMPGYNNGTVWNAKFNDYQSQIGNAVAAQETAVEMQDAVLEIDLTPFGCDTVTVNGDVRVSGDTRVEIVTDNPSVLRACRDRAYTVCTWTGTKDGAFSRATNRAGWFAEDDAPNRRLLLVYRGAGTLLSLH